MSSSTHQHSSLLSHSSKFTNLVSSPTHRTFFQLSQHSMTTSLASSPTQSTFHLLSRNRVNSSALKYCKTSLRCLPNHRSSHTHFKSLRINSMLRKFHAQQMYNPNPSPIHSSQPVQSQVQSVNLQNSPQPFT